MRGEAPESCEGLNIVAHGKYLLKYGGHNERQSFGALSILNTESLVWEAEIDLQMEPFSGHFSFIMDDKFFVVEQGFEMSYLDIDAVLISLFRVSSIPVMDLLVRAIAWDSSVSFTHMESAILASVLPLLSSVTRWRTFMEAALLKEYGLSQV